MFVVVFLDDISHHTEVCRLAWTVARALTPGLAEEQCACPGRASGGAAERSSWSWSRDQQMSAAAGAEVSPSLDDGGVH